jgi:hypothetical protein
MDEISVSATEGEGICSLCGGFPDEELRKRYLDEGNMVQKRDDERAGNQVWYRVLGQGSVRKRTKNYRVFRADFAAEPRWYSVSIRRTNEVDAIDDLAAIAGRE